ncbi:unnamed protein product, partial [Didymodactylos carnosus]
MAIAFRRLSAIRDSLHLAGIEKDPEQILEPIYGYASEPLLSLEEACEPLLPIVAGLPEHIRIAIENSKDPADGLTRQESAAIRLYSMECDSDNVGAYVSLYSHLNETLKHADRAELRPWFRYLKLFLTAIAKLPPWSGGVVWRGVRKDQSNAYPQGTEAVWWTFSSCTSALGVLESDFYSGKVGTRTLFGIETLNGRNIRNHSHFPTEDEIILLPGTHFEIPSTKRAGHKNGATSNSPGNDTYSRHEESANSFETHEVELWNLRQVYEWLKHFGKMYASDADKLYSHGVDGRMLLSAVDDQSLQDIGITSIMHRRKILMTIDDLKL